MEGRIPFGRCRQPNWKSLQEGILIEVLDVAWVVFGVLLDLDVFHASSGVSVIIVCGPFFEAPKSRWTGPGNAQIFKH